MKVRAKFLFWAIFILFFAVRLWLLFKPHVVIWDEAVYLGMGKYFYSFGTVGLWEILRPVVLPLFLGLLWKLSFGSLFYAELFMLFVSLAFAVAVYIFGRELFDEEIGAVSGIVVLLSPVFFFHSGLFLTDIPSALLALVSLILLVRRQFLISGVFSSLAFLTRFPHGILVVSIGIALVLSDRKKWFAFYKKYLTGFFYPTIPFFVFNFIMYQKEATFFDALLRPVLYAIPHQGNPFVAPQNVLFYFTDMIKDNWLLIFAFVGIALYLVKKQYTDVRMNLLLFSFVFYILYFTFIPNKQLRFGLAFLGLAAVLAGYGISFLYDRISHAFLRSLFVTLLFVLALLSVQQDSASFEWRYTSEPPILTEFYRSFSDVRDGVVLTSDPVPAAYNDVLFVPYYFSVREGLAIVKDALREGNVRRIVYTPRSFPCEPNDEECVRLREEMRSIITQYPLVFNRTYDGEEYWVYGVR